MAVTYIPAPRETDYSGKLMNLAVNLYSLKQQKEIADRRADIADA